MALIIEPSLFDESRTKLIRKKSYICATLPDSMIELGCALIKPGPGKSN